MRIEREIDFGRPRRMRCGRCGYEELVNHDWMESWDRGHECCPGCGIDCTEEDRARPTYEPEDLASFDHLVSRIFWYHTSTIGDWPQKDFDPREYLNPEWCQTMTKRYGPEFVDGLVERQKSRFLHVGTYEAAIENMLRRMGDQPEDNTQFYLFRVVLHKTAGIEPEVHPEAGNIVCDALLRDVVNPGNSIYRYINEREDEGSISLALTVDAIKSVSRIKIPVSSNASVGQRQRLTTQEDVHHEIAQAGIPDRVHRRLANAIGLVVGTNDVNHLDLELLDGLVDLIRNPSRVLALLDRIEPRYV